MLGCIDADLMITSSNESGSPQKNATLHISNTLSFQMTPVLIIVILCIFQFYASTSISRGFTFAECKMVRNA